MSVISGYVNVWFIPLTDEQVSYDKFLYDKFLYDKFTLPSVRLYAQQFFMTSFFLTRLNVFAAMMLIQSVYYTASKRTISIGSIYFDKYSLLTVQTTSF